MQGGGRKREETSVWEEKRHPGGLWKKGRIMTADDKKNLLSSPKPVLRVNLLWLEQRVHSDE